MKVFERNYSQMDAMTFVRDNVVSQYAKDNLRLSVGPVSAFSGGGMTNADIQYMIGGRDMGKLREYSQQVMKKLRSMPGVVDVDSTLTEGMPQFGVAPDRPKMSELGVSTADASTPVGSLVSGLKASDYNEAGVQY